MGQDERARLEAAAADPPKGRRSTGNHTVGWRLPMDMIEGLGADGVRDMLGRWLDDGAELAMPQPDAPEQTRNVCWSIPADVMAELDRWAAKATQATGQRWTAARVARLIFEQRPDLRPSESAA